MKRIVFLTLAVILTLALVATPAMAKPPQSNLNGSGIPDGSTLVINITYKVMNTMDSGLDGYWALEDLNRSIQVWNVHDGSFYAIVKDSGQWQTFKGVLSPGDDDYPQGSDGKGTMHGGFIMTITPTSLKSDPEYKTKGNIGTFDYKGTKDDLIAQDTSNLEPFDWVATYFDGASLYPRINADYGYWGWTYKYKNQTWNNTADGNSGDIQIP